jgi:mannose/fructose/N-acetylgalactosamine-specific phosphotransferase system component IIC
MGALSCVPCFLRFCFLGALLELDNFRFGQFMVSRPIVLGPILGWFLGDAGRGALLGAAVEALTLESLPIGPKVPINGTIAACAAVWVAFAADAPGFGLAGGLALGWAFAWSETGLRSLFSRVNAAFEEAWRQGKPAPAGLVLWAATAAHACWSFASLLLGARLLEWAAVSAKGTRVLDGFETAMTILPVLAFAALLTALRPKSS